MLYNYIIIIVCVLILTSCNEEKKNIKTNELYFQTTGYAQGTTYNIIYKDSLKRNLSKNIENILNKFDQELSIYIDSSTISKVNKLNEKSSICIKNAQNFVKCFKLSKTIYKKTNNYFNPAIYPLVKYWGFLNFDNQNNDFEQTKIDSILSIIDFSDSTIQLFISENKDTLIIKNKPSSFDFNAIAQGYSVDVIAKYLNSLNIQNYMIEIGGELITKGLNNKKEKWKIGIDKPIENSKPGKEKFQTILSLTNKALATSGNYRKFYKKNGIKYSHTINPKTGKPVTHSLLSVTVIANSCAIADAYATTFMVMGKEKTKEFLLDNKKLNLSVYLIYSDSLGKWKIWQTENFNNFTIN